MAIINIKDFGAVGNGITNDTALINKAIFSAKKGDTVYVPCGRYLVGTLKLKSDITFEMATDTVLIGSSDLSDYDEVLHDPNNRYMFEKSAYSPFATCGVLYLDMVENVEVIGGNIVFDDLSFDDKQENNPIIEDNDYISGLGYFRKPKYSYVPNKPRPVGLYISRSRNIKIKKVSFEKSAFYSAWMLNSSEMLFDGVKIRNSKYQWNGDGLHFSACNNVEIMNCDILASDDCIAVDGNYGGKSYNFNVHDCVFESTIHIIRIFTGLDFGVEKSCDEDYERYSVSNIKIRDCQVLEGAGVLLLCAFDGNIRDVQIENLTCKQYYEGTAISMSAKAGTISGVQIKNCKFDCNGIGYYCAENNGRIDKVQLKKCQFNVTPKTKFWGDDFPDGLATHMFSMPYAMVCKNVEELTLNEVCVQWNDAKFTNTFSKQDADKVRVAWGEQRISEVEPKYIQTLQLTNSNIKTINCQLENYVEE